MGTSPSLRVPVTEVQWAAVSTQPGAINVPEQMSEPPSETLATAPKVPGAASWPPTTRGLAARAGAAASRAAATTPNRAARLIAAPRSG